MAKFVVMMVKVAENKIADALETLANVAESVIVKTDRPSDTETAEEREMVGGAEEDEVRPRKRAAVVARSAAPVVKRTRLAGKVIYTPAGTKRQIDAVLAELRGQQTMRAFVMTDLVKHPGSSNAEVRERIAKQATKAGLSVESVDNVIWQMVNKGQITKRSADA